jgi:hypothetical protein
MFLSIWCSSIIQSVLISWNTLPFYITVLNMLNSTHGFFKILSHDDACTIHRSSLKTESSVSERYIIIKTTCQRDHYKCVCKFCIQENDIRITSDHHNFFFCFHGLGWDWVRLVRRQLFDLLYQPRMRGDNDCGAIGGMRIGRGNQNTRRRPAPVPFCPPQIPDDLDSKSGRRGGKPANNRLSYGTAIHTITKLSVWLSHNDHPEPFEM